MTIRHFILVGLFIVFAGDGIGAEAPTNRAAVITLAYRCDIPQGLAQEIVLHEKDGRQRRADAHAIYRRSHENGWFWVVHGYIDGNGRFPDDAPVVQEWGVMTMARGIGILEAKAAIKKMELVNDGAAVVAALKHQFPSWANGLFPHPEGPARQTKTAEPRRP